MTRTESLSEDLAPGWRFVRAFAIACAVSGDAGPLLAQLEPAWEARLGDPSSVGAALDVAIDPDGNVVVTGVLDGDFGTVKYATDGREVWVARFDRADRAFSRNVELGIDEAGNVIVSGISDRLLATVKYAPDGRELWAMRREVSDFFAPFGVVSARLAVDRAGNAHVLGSEVNFCHPEGCLGGGFVTAKYDPEGNELWAAPFDEPGFVMDAGGDLVLDVEGNVYVWGASTPCIDTGWIPSCNGGNFVTRKYDTDGNVVWTEVLEGPEEEWIGANAISLDSLGNVYVAGSESSAGTIVVSYDSSGRERWRSAVAEFRLGDGFVTPGGVVHDSRAHGMIAHPAGGVVITGGAPTFPVSRARTLRFDSSGNILWETRHDTLGRRLTTDAVGNVYLTGVAGNIDFATLVLDSDGEVIAESRLRGTREGHASGTGIVVDGSGGVVVSGFFDTEYVTIRYAPVPPPARFRRGDCDGDAETGEEEADAAALLRYLFVDGDAVPCLAACDVSADGRVDLTDALYLLNRAHGNGPPPRAPFPACGTGQSSDRRLGCREPPARCVDGRR